MPANITEIEKRLWDAADELRANSKLKVKLIRKIIEPSQGRIFDFHRTCNLLPRLVAGEVDVSWVAVAVHE